MRAIALALLGASTCAAQVQAQETHSHPPPEKLGTVVFETTCENSVARDFEHAVALLHSFAYSAAQDAFAEIVQTDPACAMAHWGVAMTYFHQLWSPPSAADLAKGRSQITLAVALNARSERERQFIAAAVAFYRDFERVPHPARAKAYAEVMSGAAQSNPNDVERRSSMHSR